MEARDRNGHTIKQEFCCVFVCNFVLMGMLKGTLEYFKNFKHLSIYLPLPAYRWLSIPTVLSEKTQLSVSRSPHVPGKACLKAECF